MAFSKAKSGCCVENALEEQVGEGRPVIGREMKEDQL